MLRPDLCDYSDAYTLLKRRSFWRTLDLPLID